MRLRKAIIALLAALLIAGLGPWGGASAQDVRTLTLGSLRLSSGEVSWLGSLERSMEFDLGGSLYLDQAFDNTPSLLEIRRPFKDELSGLETIGLGSSSLNLKQKIGRVFNLSVALSNIKLMRSSSPSNVRSMTGTAGPDPDRPGTAQSDLWALDLGLDYRDPSGHGVHLGYLYGTDPLTREADMAQPDKQGVDLGYSYDLDGFYVNLGYVYTFGQFWAGDREGTSDSAFYLRFQLHF